MGIFLLAINQSIHALVPISHASYAQGEWAEEKVQWKLPVSIL